MTTKVEKAEGGINPTVFFCHVQMPFNGAKISSGFYAGSMNITDDHEFYIAEMMEGKK